MKLKDIIRDLEEIAPPILADDGDKIGLQVGSVESDIARISVAVDPTFSVIDSAIEHGANLLISHHPLIYTPLETLAAGKPTADRIIKLISSGVALYVLHTNYDSVDGGINDVLAERLGVRVTGLLTTTRRERKFKVAVFTPAKAISAVRDAMAEAGAGVIGNYTHCSFRAEGTGTFLPLSEAQPHVGSVGKLEAAPEFRLEMLAPEWRLGAVLDAMVSNHPYEEVAYDVYPLENEPYAYGYGRIGTLSEAIKLSEFRERVGDALDSRETRMVGKPDRPIETVALCGGGGRHLIRDAAAKGADVYVTGDVGHHDFLDADMLGLAVIDAGHYETERPGMVALAERLGRMYREESLTVEFLS